MYLRFVHFVGLCCFIMYTTSRKGTSTQVARRTEHIRRVKDVAVMGRAVSCYVYILGKQCIKFATRYRYAYSTWSSNTERIFPDIVRIT